MSDIPAETETVEAHLQGSEGRRLPLRRADDVYAFMQSVGMVNDHLVELPPLRAVCQAAAREGEARVSHEETRPTRLLSTLRQPQKRAWQRMLSGRRLDLLDPTPADIAIEDIAHGLARVARWNGQTLGAHAFSVAQHSLLVDEIAGARYPDWPARWRLATLLHDAPEYVIGDLISPFKTAIGLDYKQFELRLLAAIHRRFGLPARAAGA